MQKKIHCLFLKTKNLQKNFVNRTHGKEENLQNKIIQILNLASSSVTVEARLSINISKKTAVNCFQKKEMHLSNLQF